MERMEEAFVQHWTVDGYLKKKKMVQKSPSLLQPIKRVHDKLSLVIPDGETTFCNSLFRLKIKFKQIFTLIFLYSLIFSISNHNKSCIPIIITLSLCCQIRNCVIFNKRGEKKIGEWIRWPLHREKMWVCYREVVMGHIFSLTSPLWFVLLEQFYEIFPFFFNVGVDSFMVNTTRMIHFIGVLDRGKYVFYFVFWD